jgi:pimeloyl-ACP methyl ester carboxylesterase
MPDPQASTSSPTVVLVHGAWHGSWCWAKVVPLLEEHGLAVHTVDLPSTGPDVDALGNLDDDVTTLATLLDKIPGPKVLVGHSYGGLPITEAGAGRDDIAHLVYVCAFMLDVGQSLLDAAGGQPMSWWQVSEDGKSITAGRPESVFYSDCEPREAAAAAARLTPQSMSSCTTPLRAAAWQTVPATYVVADRDPELPQAVQEMMATGKARRLRHVDSAHSPFLSRPEELAALITDIARSPFADEQGM